MFGIKYISFAIFCLTLLLVQLNPSLAAKKTDLSKYQKRTGQKYLDEVAQRDGIVKLKSGMLVEV